MVRKLFALVIMIFVVIFVVSHKQGLAMKSDEGTKPENHKELADSRVVKPIELLEPILDPTKKGIELLEPKLDPKIKPAELLEPKLSEEIEGNKYILELKNQKNLE